MKTLADLKRDIKVGDSITLIESPAFHKWTDIKRYVVKKQGNGVYLNPDKAETKGSFLEFVNAKLTEYDGKEIRVYAPGTRPLTDNEKAVYDNRPSNRKENEYMVEQDLMTDTNLCYWHDKTYFSKAGMDWLFHANNSTKRLDHNDMTVTDEQIKGELQLRYVIGD